MKQSQYTLFTILITSLVISGCALQKASPPPAQTPSAGILQPSMSTISAPSAPVQVVLKTSMGDITLELYLENAPKTVDNFLKLARQGFYNGTKFHRVIKDFMIQGGDPLSKDETKKAFWGTGGPGYQFEDEINARKIVKGSFAMANAGHDTNGSQFFIVTAQATPWLDGKHTNFGMVVSGMDIVDAIARVDTDEDDRPLQDVVIREIEIGAFSTPE